MNNFTLGQKSSVCFNKEVNAIVKGYGSAGRLNYVGNIFSKRLLQEEIAKQGYSPEEWRASLL